MTSVLGRNVAQSTFGQLLGAIQLPQRELVRKIEKTNQKINNAEVALAFNLVCLKENILPGYTDIKIHDEEARNSDITHKFRKELVERQVQQKKEIIHQLKEELTSLKEKWNEEEIPAQVRDRINKEISRLQQQHRKGTETRNIAKLARLTGGNIKLPHHQKGFINLVPNLELTEEQEELLNFGLNCHYMSKPRKHRKRLELEVLLEDIQNLEKQRKVTTTSNLQASILAEAAKQRGSHQSKLLQKRHFVAAKQLRSRDDITIRRADKTAAIVILPRQEYLNKMDSLLEDTTKFERITRNPTEDIKKKLNSTISAINMIPDAPKFSKLTGEYSPGYAYGNVKTHKPGNPLRPIISQIPTATYTVAKRLNDILTPYVPSDFAIASAKDFLEILRDAPKEDDDVIASLDVESLFTNVPVDKTIEFILDRVYRCSDTPTLAIPEEKLRSLLQLCTKEAPFTCPSGNMYRQVDGVAMGSPLGVLFANFYMGTIEAIALKNKKPPIYCRYIDDIFVLLKEKKDISQLKQALSEASSLSFTFEESCDGRLPFLDVLVTAQEKGFDTTVYVKPTNKGLCLNGNSECPQRYLRTTINAYVRRALSHCSTWNSIHQELERVTQVLVNNGYRNSEITNAIKTNMEKFHAPTTTTNDEKQHIKLFYKNHMTSQYKEEEKAIKDIVKKNVIPTNPDNTIQLIIYYQSRKTSQLLISNKEGPRKSTTQEDHVIYEHKCNSEGCRPHTYIGMTRTSLSRRLTCHLKNGAIHDHYCEHHRTAPTRQDLVKGTNVLDKEIDSRRLILLEAIYIAENKPTMNCQTRDLQVLPTHKRTTNTTSALQQPIRQRAV